MNKKLLSLAANFIIGLMLLFLGLTIVVGGSAGNIVLAVFAMFLGFGYLIVGLLNFLKVSDDSFGKILRALEISIFPIYIIVEVIVEMCLLGAQNLSPADYILKIALLAAALTTGIFAFVTAFSKNENLQKVLGIALVGFIGLHLLSFVFVTGGGLNTLGGLSLVGLILFACYLVLSVDVFKNTLIKAKGDAEKHLSDNKSEVKNQENTQEESSNESNESSEEKIEE